MLKHCLLALMFAGLLYAVTPSAIAQDSGNNQQSPPANTPPEHGHGRGHFDPARRTEMLTKQLNLTSDQQSKVLELLKAEQSQMEGLHSDSSLSQEDRHAKMMEIHKTSDDQIRALLDPEQQKKWDTMQSQHQQWQGRHQPGQAPGAPDSSQPQ